MSSPNERGTAPVRARKAHQEEVGPESPTEHAKSVTPYLMRRARRRREIFLRRAEASSLRKEVVRNLYLAGCLLLDLLVIPEATLTVPLPWGWLVTGVALALALWLEYRIYRAYFSLPPLEE